MKDIMERILITAMHRREEHRKKWEEKSPPPEPEEEWKPEPINLWMTGHSLGGALASLVMALLQKIVEWDDPLEDSSWPVDGDDACSGLTVLEVMISQFYKTYPFFEACQNCSRCSTNKNGNAESTLNPKELCFSMDALRAVLESFSSTNVKTHAKAATMYQPLPRLQLLRRVRHLRRLSQAISGMPVQGGYGSKLLVLRDCYTFGSPRVENTVFAKVFASNQKARNPYHASYWRIANEFDHATKFPPSLKGYDINGPPTRLKSSLLDYWTINTLDIVSNYPWKASGRSLLSNSLTSNKSPTHSSNKISAALSWMWNHLNIVGTARSHQLHKYLDNLYDEGESFKSYIDPEQERQHEDSLPSAFGFREE
ncbi:hypothetical protein EC968_010616 [Mortierella alpina]|nr:hypothetical protein EC968_010616 [Mortierella alpina]